jgi:O-antigen/teichoic acid export membrane protein
MKASSGFYSSLTLLLLLNAIVKPIWIFGIDRQVQNVVGTETYGIYFSLLSLSVVLNFLADFGLTTYFTQRVASKESGFSAYQRQILLLKLGLSVVYCLFLFGIAFITRVQHWDILLYVALIQVFTSLFLFFRGIITAQQWFRTDAWLSVLDKGLMIIACGFLLYFPAFKGTISIELFLVLQVFAVGIAALAAFFYLLKMGNSFGRTGNAFRTAAILKKSIPFGLIVLLMAAHARSDAFLLERLHPAGEYEAGIYAAAYRLLDAANICGYLVASFLLPYLARQWNDQGSVNAILLQCRHLLLMLAVSLVAVTFTMAPWIERVLYDHPDAYAADILRWCLPAIAGYYLTHIYGTVLTATGRIADFCYIVLAGWILNLALNMSLIPTWGAKGCCIAALGSQFSVGLALIIYSQQKMRINLHPRSLLIYIFTGLTIFGLLYLSVDGPIPQWLLIIVASIVAISVMIFTRMLDLRRLISSWKARINF